MNYKELLADYLHLEQKIRRKKLELYREHKNHKHRNFHTIMKPDNELGIYTISGFRDYQIVDHLDMIDILNKQIKEYEYRLEKFSMYLETISPSVIESIADATSKEHFNAQDPNIQEMVDVILAIEHEIEVQNGTDKESKRKALLSGKQPNTRLRKLIAYDE